MTVMLVLVGGFIYFVLGLVTMALTLTFSKFWPRRLSYGLSTQYSASIWSTWPPLISLAIAWGAGKKGIAYLLRWSVAGSWQNEVSGWFY